MKPIILQLGGIASSSVSPSSSTPATSSTVTQPPGAGDQAVDLSVLDNKDADRQVKMTTVVTNTLTEQHPQHPSHHPQQQLHRNSHSMSKSITRMLQHSILQLCNEHIGYTHKLQILGVLCMTVDDEQQELVVKVNNTLKRVGPVTPKDGAQPHMAGMTPSVPTLAQHLPPPSHMGTDLSLCIPTRAPGAFPIHATADMAPDSGAPLPTNLGAMSPASSPVPLNMSGRKSHGRKGSNPTKVSQVMDENLLDTDDDDDSDGPLTIIPEAPELTNSRLSSAPPSPLPPATSTPTTPSSSSRHRGGGGGGGGPSGSAKRKPSHQFRVPQYPSPSGSPYIRSLPGDSAGSPYGPYVSPDVPGNGTPGKGINLPIYVAGTYSQAGQDGAADDDDEQPMNLAAGSSSSPSSSSRQNGLPQMNGRDSREGSPTTASDRPGSRSSLHHARGSDKLKDEPDDDSESEYKEQLNSLEEYASVRALFSGSDGADRDSRMDGLHAALPYPPMFMPRQGFESPSPSSRDGDGLTIKYTSTGPYTVSASGKDVSNASRIKDIIMYDDQSPLSAQKGARIETDYIVDKLGMDGRKRRRRAPEDLLTPEEIAEYLGQPERSDYSFRCKYCSEEFESITRYIHHTLAAHQAYICHQCGKSFTTKSSLLRHRPIHTGMRRFACSICKKTFYRKDKCKAHIRRHLGLDHSNANSAVESTTSNSAVVADSSVHAVEEQNSQNSSQFPTPVEASALDADSP